MHAISAVTLHPSQKYWSGQSMDNQSECSGLAAQPVLVMHTLAHALLPA